MVVANRYTRTAMVLHWLIAALMVGNVVLVWIVGALPDADVRPVIDAHKSIGLTVLGLAVLRVLWRIGHRPPPLPRQVPAIERVGAHAAHLLLYGLILALPISGWIHDSAFAEAAQHPLTIFGLPWFRIPQIANLPAPEKDHVHATWFAIHSALGYALYALFTLHVLGALKHQFIDRWDELGRILPLRRRAPAE